MRICRHPKKELLLKKSGFTLIELLVVISIIALLLSILMPSLQKVRRQAKSIVCSSNLSQVVKGLITYSVSNNNKLMTRPAGTPDLAWHPAVKNDMRAMLVEYAALNSQNLLFCPLVKKGSFAARPGIDPAALRTIPDEDKGYGQYFNIIRHGSGNLHYYMGYHLFAGMQDDANYGSQWLWRYSGNSSNLHEPRTMSSRDCLIADRQQAWPRSGFGDIGLPVRSNHGIPFQDTVNGVKFTDSNAAYGDGHVERHSELKYSVRRISMNGGLFEY